MKNTLLRYASTALVTIGISLMMGSFALVLATFHAIEAWQYMHTALALWVVFSLFGAFVAIAGDSVRPYVPMTPAQVAKANARYYKRHGMPVAPSAMPLRRFHGLSASTPCASCGLPYVPRRSDVLVCVECEFQALEDCNACGGLLHTRSYGIECLACGHVVQKPSKYDPNYTGPIDSREPYL